MQSIRSSLAVLARRLTAILRLYWWVALVFGMVVLGLADVMIPTSSGWQWAGLYWYTSIGNANDYDQSDGECGYYDTIVRNGGNLVATLRRVECTGGLLAAPPFRDYFVFVHSNSEPHHGTNLVLRYRKGADDPDWTVEPRVTWSSMRTLAIATGQLTSIDFDLPTLARTSIDDMSIMYVSGGTIVPPDYQFRRAPWMQFKPSGSIL